MKYLIFLTFIPLSLLGNIYNYSPDSVLKLAGGYDPYKPLNVYPNCIDYDKVQNLDTTDSLSSNVFISLIKSYKDLYKYSQFSASAAASYKIFKGGANTFIESESMFHSDSLTWLIMFKSDYGRVGLKNPTLKKELRDLNPVSLRNRCGSEVVLQARKGSMVYLLLTIKNIENKQRKKLESSFSAKVSGGFWGGKLKASYKKIVNAAMMAHQTSIQFHSIGGPGIEDLADLISKDYVDYEMLPKIMNEYIHNLNSQTAAWTQYQTADINSFITKKIDSPPFNHLVLNDLYYQFIEADSKLKRLDEILYGVQSINYHLEENKDLLEKQRESIFETKNELLTSMKDCYDPKKECIPYKVNYSSFIKWPGNSDYFCESKRKSALREGIIHQHDYSMAESRNLIPIISFNQLLGYEGCRD